MMHRTIPVILLLVFYFQNTSSGQQFLLQGWYWDYPKAGAGYSWADTLALHAADLEKSGFSHVWFPPHAACSSGPNSNGYDPRDLFIGNATTGVGSRADLDAMLDSLVAHNVAPVADLVFNHRDGGYPEANPAVEGWIENMTATKVNAGDQPFPTDRVHGAIPLAGTNGAGDYYIKIKSASGHGNFHNKPYKLYLQTKKTGWQNLPALTENEPNGGGQCNEPSTPTQLGRDMNANVDAFGCLIDEFKLTLSANDFFPTGDTLFLYWTNRNVNGLGDYSDHLPFEIWHNGQNVQPQMAYRTWTGFTNLPSGRGQMSWANFKPNGNPTQLAGDEDAMYFFYDYDQNVPSTIDTLNAWTKWNWTDLHVRGLRMDAVKHFTPAYVGNLLDYLHGQGMNPSLVVGESFTTDIGQLSGWVNAVLANMDAATQAAISPKIFDFALREKLRQVCDHGVDARDLFHAACAENGLSGFNVVTFVNNHDFRDASPGFNAMVRQDVELAYAYILTNNKLGVPTVFYPDYYGYPPTGSGFEQPYHPSDKAPRKADIDRLIRAHKNHIVGATQSIYLNDYGSSWASNFASGTANQCVLFQLQHPISASKPTVVVAINFGNTALDVTQNIQNLGGLMPVGQVFSPVAGTDSVLMLNNSNQVRIQLPARSFGVWVQGIHTECD